MEGKFSQQKLEWYFEQLRNKRLTDYIIPSYVAVSSTHPTEGVKIKNSKENKMAELKQVAKDYIAPTTRNISELDEVSVSLEVKKKTVGEGEKEFTYSYITVGEEEYRVGASVLKQLKAHLEAKPNMQKFSVNKEGEGLKTVYTVLPL